MPENTVLASIELLRLIIQRTDTVVEYAKKFRRQATLVNGAISDEILAGFYNRFEERNEDPPHYPRNYFVTCSHQRSN